MSKKRQKSAGSTSIPKWEQALLGTNFGEENGWDANVTFLVGNKVEDYAHIKVLAEAVAAGSRKLFSVFSQEELFQQVKELGNPKAKKTKDTPQHSEVCEPCKLYLDSGEDIPLPLLAKLIKFKLLNVKQNDLKRRDAEKKAANEKDKDKGGAKGKKERGKSPAKKGGKKTPEPPSPKKESKLRKRGDEDLDSRYIDDEPNDGPKHYVLIYGFNHPHLLRYLDELGVYVDCIIKVESEDYTQFEVKPEPEPTIDNQSAVPPVVQEKDEKTLALEEAERKVKEKEKKLLTQFWTDVLAIMQQAPNSSKLHDVARLSYIIKNDIIPDDLEDNELKSQFGSNMFEAIAVMIYDLLDAKRIWRSYLTNMRMLHVYAQGEAYQPPLPTEAQSQISAPTPAQQPPPTAMTTATMPVIQEGVELPQEVDLRYYKELMSCVPQESVSVPLIMHCMLEQIQATEDGKLPPSEQSKPPRTDGLDPTLASHISGMAFKLALTQDEQMKLASDFDVPEGKPQPRTQPLLVNMQDDITLRTFQLRSINGFNAKEAEMEMLKYLPFEGALQFPHPTSRAAKERASRLQELIHFCATDGLTQSEIDRAFKQFVFECMDLTTVDENGIIVAKSHEGYEGSVIPWDDPYPFFKGMACKPNKTEPAKDLLNPNMPIEGFEEYTTGNVTPRSEPNSRPESKTEEVPLSQVDSKELSRPDSSGILKSPRPASAKSKTSTHSVHFERDSEGKPISSHDLAQTAERIEASQEPNKTVEESMDDIIDATKRNVDAWCFAEHFEPNVLLQVLKSASYNLPYMDMYYHKRDHTLLVVLHNPHNQELQSHVDWETNLHSNVGFRNYLEHVSESIWEWAEEENAKYLAHQLAEEVEKERIEDETSSRPSSGGKGKKRGDRSKSPKKSDSKSKSRSRSRSEDRSDSSLAENKYVRTNSLKAQKEEADRIKAEEEEKERLKNEKRAKSAQKKRDKEREKEEREKAATAEKSKRPGSRGSAKSRSGSKEPKDSMETLVEGDGEPHVEEKYWPFTGYDVSNNLIHASGVTSTLFPADGGQIRTERVQFIQGTTSVKTSIMKDNHVFMVHVLDPMDPNAVEQSEEVILDGENQENGMEKADLEKSEKEEEAVENDNMENNAATKREAPKKPAIGSFASFSAQLSDGMCISLSTYGETGEPKDGKGHEPEPYIPPARSPSPTPLSPNKGKKGDKGKEKAPPTPEPLVEEETKDETGEEEQEMEQPFQQLYVTCPDGLNVTWFLESSTGIQPEDETDRKVLVKQNYPFKTNGSQPSEALRKSAMQEVSRIINKDGTVIKTLQDDSVVVMFRDGTTSEFSTAPSSLLPPSRNSSPQRPSSTKSDKDRETPKRMGSRMSRKTASIAAINKDNDDAGQKEEKKGHWITTAPNGERVATMADGSRVPGVKNALCSMASDPMTDQSMCTREDHTIVVKYPDGTMIAEHSDKTRITSYFKTVRTPIDCASYHETGEYPAFEDREVPFVMIECPGYATVTYNCETSECITSFGNGTRVHTYKDGGYDIDHCDGGMLLVDSDGCSMYRPRPNNDIEFLQPNQDHVYVMRHFADVVCETVDNEGNVFNVKNTGETMVITANGEPVESVEVDSEDGNEKNENNGQTVIHTKKVVQYKQHAPRFFVVHSNGSGTELLRYQDVAEYLTTAENDPTVAILNDPLPDFPGVNGITILKPYLKGVSEQWVKKYERQTIMPEGLLSRNLHNLPSKEEKKPGPSFGNNVGTGLAVGTAVIPPPPQSILKCPNMLELRQLLQYKPMEETLRTKLHDGLKEYAEFVRERNLETSMNELNEPRDESEVAKAEELQALVKDENLAHLEDANIKAIYEKVTAPPPPSPPPTPAPQRTLADWERDKREIAEEIEGRRALRKNIIPPYFESEMGKAFLLSQAPDAATMCKHLSEDPRDQSRDPATAVRSNTPSSVQSQDQPPRYTSSASPEKGHYYAPITPGESPQKMMHSETPSNLRPGAPTPAHATGQGSPAPLRPGNPTPAHGMKESRVRPDNPTPKQQADGDGTYRDNSAPAIPEESPADLNTPADFVTTRSLEVNVTGQPRQEPVHVPAYINSGRPGAIPNERFTQIEDPVRNKVMISSVAGATINGSKTISNMRGFELLPSQVDFGFLREGYTYQFIVHLKNMGIDSCRYKLRQPPPSTGLKVIYKPGPIAAGMKAELAIEIYAIAVGVKGESGIGAVSHDLEIITETDTMYLPITATILTPDEYDSKSPTSPRVCKFPGVKLTNTKPPSREGIIRPRREDVPDSGMTMEHSKYSKN
ncbi:unnamed protein product [Owenia fusiformis]|uniref:Uncharacterized protein n=1 Tax=Owenia fusiformis TaxID=6347 RepID=A0A8J1XIT2_OWEFU|nr:unnamed protein product [Owenia fusiformis]